jgi:hypothetical protein
MIVCARKGHAVDDDGHEINSRPPSSDAKDDKGPTEKLRDDAKSAAGELVPQESGVPGAQNPDSEEIKDEKGPNTE